MVVLRILRLSEKINGQPKSICTGPLKCFSENQKQYQALGLLMFFMKYQNIFVMAATDSNIATKK